MSGNASPDLFPSATAARGWGGITRRRGGDWQEGTRSPTPGPRACSRDAEGVVGSSCSSPLPRGQAGLFLGSRGGWTVSSGTLLPQGFSRAPALPTWHLQRAHQAHLRGKETPSSRGGGSVWEGPCLGLAKPRGRGLSWGLKNRATWLSPPSLGSVLESRFQGRSSLALLSTHLSLLYHFTYWPYLLSVFLTKI